MKPRLVIVETLASLAGGQRVLVDLLPALTREFEVTVVVPASGRLTEALPAHSVSAVILPMGARYSLQKKTPRDLFTFALNTPRLVLTWARLVRATRAQLVLINSAPAFPWGTLGSALGDCPVVWFAHNVFTDSKTVWLLRALARWPGVRAVLATSAKAGEQYRVGRKTIVIPPGVDVNLFRPDAFQRDQKRREFHLPPEGVGLAIVGDLMPLKGQRLAIEAVHHLAARHPQLHLLVIGEARPEAESQRYAAELRQAAQGSRRIHFIGYRSDLPAVLAACDGLIVASTTETGPLVLLQALACGLPVISTPVGHAPALLEDRACGYLFPVGNMAALAEVMEKFLNSTERVTLGQRGRARIVAEWSLARMQTQVVAALQRVNG